MEGEPRDPADPTPVVIIGGVVTALARVFGKHGGSGKTHARVRAAKAAAAARAATDRWRATQGRTFPTEPTSNVYMPDRVYTQQPTLPDWHWGPNLLASGIVQAYLYTRDMNAANEAARAASEPFAPWYAREEVYGPPGPYEAGGFYGLNFPLIEGSRQDPRGIRAPAMRHFSVPFLGGHLR